MNKVDLISGYNSLSPVDQADFQKQTGLIPLPISTKFSRIGITVAIPAKKESFTQKQIHKLLVDSGQFSPNCVDNDIAGWEFDNKSKYNGCQVASGSVDKFLQNITHKDIIAEGKMLKTHMQVNLLQGALLAIELVKAGAINEKNRGVIIYLTETINATSCRLNVWLDDVGFVKVNVREVYSDNEFSAGYGVLSSN